MTTSPCVKPIVSAAVLYIALELSSKEWKLAFADSLSRNPRIRTIKVAVGSFYFTQKELVKEISAAKKALDLPEDCKVVSCYEAGRQGFWVHRCLSALNIQNYIVEPTSMLVTQKNAGPRPIESMRYPSSSTLCDIAEAINRRVA